ncbi:SgcJ/EcaC family oxidoreductase [Desulfobotulus sp.]|jgi:uncharacterized protein (TIGR02246 family)|uniref:SgcJ/EcaC family oxidoreductase n=1 Tax=Desulfobotulus sp. TaxID=1940337 RepID=UPI002A35D176|nr:SgcJ/EcaC family oxidoreductase [Desulfobotulus sp.]MDY0162368.1 SgcJ/EcaC family oxidoreductase [Desulfobotulus sp.]
MKYALCFLCLLLLTGCATHPISAPPSPQRSEICHPASPEEIAALFDRWNQALLSNDAKKVVANYDENAILLPTVSNKPRFTSEEREDYFHHFLEKSPSGSIDLRHIEIACNTALDAGLYTFTFAKTGERVQGRYSYTYKWNGREWLITSHHSSLMPEATPDSQ